MRRRLGVDVRHGEIRGVPPSTMRSSSRGTLLEKDLLQAFFTPVIPNSERPGYAKVLELFRDGRNCNFSRSIRKEFIREK